ncbi:5'-nucleotidase SurE-like isoform X2 [Hibiscus syriacus]|uniref:5'-nucleotidase SurE-like isoform X2 n=1 Tax=Hibiscus syriacus TaxID=106335 RepID=UPI001924A8EC|nr:5'-nucleotidase SurE-like isoform X2 [Hibiscus syriacus]
MTTTKKNMLPSGLVNNLQEVLSRKGGNFKNDKRDEHKKFEAAGDSTETSTSASDENDSSKPVVLVTNGEGIDSLGLAYLVQALVGSGLYNVHVCAPQSDKSVSGHSVTVRETITVTPSEIEGATAYEVSGTTVDCVSLALSGALFSWSKPLLVISGINRGSSCGHHMFYSGVVAGAREALICGVPSLSISLNWKKEESQDSDFKNAVTVTLPLVAAAIRDIEKGVFPKSCFLNIEIPTSPSTNKGFKLTMQSMWRSAPNWLAVSANRHPSSAAHFMSNQQSLGLQLAQLSRDASAAFINKEEENADEDLDFKALDNGFVAVTPISLCPQIESDILTAASDWISGVFMAD